MAIFATNVILTPAVSFWYQDESLVKNGENVYFHKDAPNQDILQVKQQLQVGASKEKSLLGLLGKYKDPYHAVPGSRAGLKNAYS